MPRIERLDAPGVLHQVIIHGIERRQSFRDDSDRENFHEHFSILVPETQTICLENWVMEIFGFGRNVLYPTGRSNKIQVAQEVCCAIGPFASWVLRPLNQPGVLV